MERNELRVLLDQTLTADSLRILCYQLEIDHDNLMGNNKGARIVSLLAHLERHGRLDGLRIIVENNQLPDPEAKVNRSPRELRLRQSALHNVRATWIEGVLENAVSEEMYLSLGLEYKPTAVAKRTLRTASQADTPIPDGKPISEIFVENGRSLLILGAPGSGKTITLLQLARDLVNQAFRNPDAPLPFVVNLSSWAAKREPLADWLVEELFLQYQLSRKLARSWLAEEQLTLLLDGLDEVAEAHRDACVEAINTFKGESDVEVVVCSRLADYERLEEKLNVGTAVVIQSLTDEQVDDFLSREELELAAVRVMIQKDGDLLSLSKSPFFLAIIAIAYQGLNIADLKPLKNAKVRHHLFKTYVTRSFHHRSLTPKADYSEIQAQRWLSELAVGMVAHKLTLFYIERLQPTWIPRASIERYHWIITMIFGVSSELIFILSGVLNGVENRRLAVMLFSVLFVGLLGFLTGDFIGNLKIKLVEEIVWTRQGILPWDDNTGLFLGLIMGLFGWLMGETNPELPDGLFFRLGIEATPAHLDGQLFELTVEISLWLMSGLSGWLILGRLAGWLILGLILGTILGITFGIIFRLIQAASGQEDKKLPRQPNQSIQSSRNNALKMMLVFGLIGGLTGSLLGGTIGGWMGGFIGEMSDWLSFWLNVGLRIGLIGGLSIGFFGYGGTAVIQHYTVRYLLSRANTLPRPFFSDEKLIAFLDAMAERMILRRVGGGWIFIHQTLLEYFAELTPEEIEQLAADSE
ncbi:MAG: NACHT domain-containing protein [Chloroflexota bacterium]